MHSHRCQYCWKKLVRVQRFIQNRQTYFIVIRPTPARRPSRPNRYQKSEVCTIPNPVASGSCKSCCKAGGVGLRSCPGSWWSPLWASPATEESDDIKGEVSSAAKSSRPVMVADLALGCFTMNGKKKWKKAGLPSAMGSGPSGPTDFARRNRLSLEVERGFVSDRGREVLALDLMRNGLVSALGLKGLRSSRVGRAPG